MTSAFTGDIGIRRPSRDAIGARQAWSVATGRGVVAAILDTGLSVSSLTHLRERIVDPYDLLGGSTAVGDVDGHGTEVASVIAGAGDYGVWGVAPDVSVMPIGVAGTDGQAKAADVARAIGRAVSGGAEVINLSIGSSQDDPGIAAAIENAVERHIVVVAAAGDTSAPGPLFPASMSIGVIAVQAGGIDGSPAPMANRVFGNGLTAPGADIDAVTVDRVAGGVRARVERARGSSMSAAIVTGAIAILMQCARKLGSNLDVSRYLALLRLSTSSRPFFSIPRALAAEGC